MDVSSAVVAVNGTRLYCEVAGQGTPVVFIHGLGLDTRMWDAQFERFACSYRAVRYDVRGFGRSDVPSTESFNHADDLRALLDHLGAPGAHVIGLSMGGRIALHHALLYPEATLSLTLVDSALDGHAWTERWDASFDAIVERAESDGPRAGNALWLEHELFSPARELPDVHAKLTEIVTDYSGWGWVNDAHAVGIDPPTSKRLHEIHAPTLVIVGERDLPDFQRIAETLTAGIVGVRKVAIKGAGHMSNMEAPAEFNSTVLAFIGRIEDASGKRS
jgi:3-oxoadipate enol-lactonase